MEIGAIGAVRGQQLTPAEQQEVTKLAARDREVRRHEAQHMAAAGGMGAGVQYEYEMGPDGKRYAVGGHTEITVPTGGTPEERLASARQLRAAARAPGGELSSKDLAAASSAGRMEAEARQALAEEQTQEVKDASASGQGISLRGFDAFA